MKVIAVSHGSYSKGLVDSVQMLVGEQESLVAYGLFPEQTVATLTEKLEKEINDTPEGRNSFLNRSLPWKRSVKKRISSFWCIINFLF